MTERIGYIGILLVVIAGFIYVDSNSSEKTPAPILVFTQVPVEASPLAVTDNDLLPIYDKSRIVRLNYERMDSEPENLTPTFYAAGSPSISFDNRLIVFSGKQNKNDPWQIWLMNLDGSGKQKVFESTDNLLTPAFLPNGKIVFSREQNDPDIGLSYALYTCKKDGSELNQITFHPHRDLYTSVLHDGRIAMVSQQVYPEKKRPVFMVLRPDGTKAQTFYHDKANARIKSIIRETPDQQLVFVKGNEKRDELVSLSYADPGIPPQIIASYGNGNIQSVDNLDHGHLVVSSQPGGKSVFGLYRMNFNGEKELLLEDRTYHSIEPVTLNRREVPKKLPSSISNEKGSGIIFSQNAEQSRIRLEGDPETEYVRVLGIDKTLKEIAVADDGSFYLEVQSDMPIRFQSLNRDKEVLRGPSAWIWLRTNERRGCVGCHTNKAIAPDNVVPEAIKSPPVKITDTSRVTDTAHAQAIRNMLNDKETLNFED